MVYNRNLKSSSWRAGWAVLLAGSCCVFGEPEKLDFNDDVQPILSEYCYHCHGPDSSTREPKDDPLRLDTEEGAFSIRESIGEPAILKGDGENSEVYYRMTSDDKTEIMPTPKAHKVMKPEEIELIKRWIDEGAEYEPHWSFVAPERPELPEVSAKSEKWVRNEIDRFVAAKHEEAGVGPNEEEEGERLARRISFDLTGLPPSVEKIGGWSENSDLVIEELLGTDEYAEHFARHWLDAARYGDTHGIHIDNYRSIWPFRDWVIKAFKKNMPFDEFTKLQVAGDMMPNATIDQKVASGFNRCLPTTGEGGAIPEEWEVTYAQDQVDTVAAVWLGLTTGCAACHDHKFDPISAKDNYSLTAFFRNTTMSAMDQNRQDHPPSIVVPREEDRPEWERLEYMQGKLKAQLAKRKKEGEEDFLQWLESAKNRPPRVDYYGVKVHLPLEGDADEISGWSPEGSLSGTVESVEQVDGPFGKTPKLGDKVVTFAGKAGKLDPGSGVSASAWVSVSGEASGALVSQMERTGNGLSGWDLWVRNGRIGLRLIDEENKRFITALTWKKLPENEWKHVAVTYDPKQKANRYKIRVFLDGKAVGAEVKTKGWMRSLESGSPLRVGLKSSGGETKGEVLLQDFRLFNRTLSHGEVVALTKRKVVQEALMAKSKEEWSDEERKLVRNYYFGVEDPESRVLLGMVREVEEEKGVLADRGGITLVMEEKKGQEPFAHVLTRGDYQQKAERVTADVPQWLMPLPEGAPKNRLGLAEWLVDPKNPLPARVTMNRLWYYFFGEGLVKTTEDFGIMGERPTHPKLLDWLAVEFVESGWDLQHMIRLIVESATYRQSGRIEERHLEKDPENKLLTRGPRYRMDAEQIRDLALKASGLLVSKVGGPSVKPYQPEGVWEAVAMNQSNTRFYKQDEGENLYRRSMYTFWKRTAPPASMDIFDAPSRESFCVRRDRTNTPLQAFVLMNDPQFVEASRVLAETALREEASFEGRLNLIFLSLVGREAESEEMDIVRESLESMMRGYREEPERAIELLEVGASRRDETLDAVELAGWTMVATQVLNLDETITK